MNYGKLGLSLEDLSLSEVCPWVHSIFKQIIAGVKGVLMDEDGYDENSALKELMIY